MALGAEAVLVWTAVKKLVGWITETEIGDEADGVFDALKRRLNGDDRRARRRAEDLAATLERRLAPLMKLEFASIKPEDRPAASFHVAGLIRDMPRDAPVTANLDARRLTREVLNGHDRPWHGLDVHLRPLAERMLDEVCLWFVETAPDLRDFATAVPRKLLNDVEALHRDMADGQGRLEGQLGNLEAELQQFRDEAGARWDRIERAIGIQGPAVESDEDAINLPDIAGMHAAVRDAARKLMQISNRLGNTLEQAWIDVPAAARSWAEAVDRPLKEVPRHIYQGHAAMVDFSKFLEMDAAFRADPNGSANPLVPELKQALDAVVNKSAAWLHGSPTSRRLEALANARRPRQDMSDAARRMVELPAAQRALVPNDAALLAALLGAGTPGAPHAGEARLLGQASAFNLLLDVARIIPHLQRPDASDAERELLARLLDFRRDAREPAEALAAGLPAHLRRMVAGDASIVESDDILRGSATAEPALDHSQMEDERMIVVGRIVTENLDLPRAALYAGSKTGPDLTWTLLQSTHLLPEILTLDVHLPIPGNQPDTWKFPVRMLGGVMTSGQGDKKIRLSLQRASFQIHSQDFRPAKFAPDAMPPGWSPVSYELGPIFSNRAEAAGSWTLSDPGEILYVSLNDSSESLTSRKSRTISLRAVSRISDIVVRNYDSLSVEQSITSEHRNRRAIVDIILAQALPRSVGGLVFFGECNFRYGPSDASTVSHIKADTSYVFPSYAVGRLVSVLTEKSLDFAKLVQAGGLDPARDLRHENLHNIDLRDQDLSGFDWTGADLSWANFSGATGIDYDSLSTAKLVGVQNLAPPPEFSQDEAEKLILGGSAPPAAWQPFITELQFTGNDSLSDLTPLAQLSALRRLRLDGTQVSNIQPLVGLTALHSLDLSGTQVSDIAPLAGLTRLRRLVLDGTRVTDLSPVGKIDGLTISGP